VVAVDPSTTYPTRDRGREKRNRENEDLGGKPQFRKSTTPAGKEGDKRGAKEKTLTYREAKEKGRLTSFLSTKEKNENGKTPAGQ